MTAHHLNFLVTLCELFISSKMADCSNQYCLSCLIIGADQSSRDHESVEPSGSSSIPRMQKRENGDGSTSRNFSEFSTSVSDKVMLSVLGARAGESVHSLKNPGLVKQACPAKITKSIQDEYFSPIPKFEEISPPVINSDSQKSKTKSKTKREDEETVHQNKSYCVGSEDFKTPHVPATIQYDSLSVFGRTSSQKSLKVNVRTSAKELYTPAKNLKFTRIVPRDEVDGTPVSSAKSLNQMYKEAIAEEDSGYSSPGMFAGRPCKVGREKMDIVTELGHHEPALLKKIFVEFNDEDIVRFSGVCREWRHIAEDRKEMASKKRRFLQQKSKPRKHVKENYPRQIAQRATVSSFTPLGEVQRLGEPQASSTPSARLNHDNFRQASESLLADELLTKCAKVACQSPAKLLMNGQRGQCTRCGFDFCTNCRCEFHVSSLCPALREKNMAKQGNGVGSERSKRSLRRLARLESYP